VIWVYAIADGLRSLPPVEGIGGSPLTIDDCAGLDVVATVHDRASFEPSEESLLAHARVVEALFSRSPALLPVRFGLAFEDFPGVERAVRARSRELRESLELVRGRVELGLRVVGEEREDVPAVSSGRAYLEARRAQVVTADRLAGDLHACLAERAGAAVRSTRADGRLLLSGAYLVDRAAIPSFQEAVHALESKHPALTFALTGPWPPYSFAGMETP
jgi:hypothetical protein